MLARRAREVTPAYRGQRLRWTTAPVNLRIKVTHEFASSTVLDAPQCYDCAARPGGEKRMRKPDYAFAMHALSQRSLTCGQRDHLRLQPQPADCSQVKAAVREDDMGLFGPAIAYARVSREVNEPVSPRLTSEPTLHRCIFP